MWWWCSSLMAPSSPPHFTVHPWRKMVNPLVTLECMCHMAVAFLLPYMLSKCTTWCTG